MSLHSAGVRKDENNAIPKGIDELRVLLEEVKSRGIRLVLMGVHLPVKEVFKSSGFIDEVDPGFLIENRKNVITDLFQQIDHVYCKGTCPYTLFHECETVK